MFATYRDISCTDRLHTHHMVQLTNRKAALFLLEEIASISLVGLNFTWSTAVVRCVNDLSGVGRDLCKQVLS